MLKRDPALSERPPALVSPVLDVPRAVAPAFFIALTLLGLGFAIPLYRLAVFALGSELYSYILIIPAVSGYAAWLRRAEVRSCSLPHRRLIGSAFGFVGVCGVLTYVGLAAGSAAMPVEDQLALTTGAFVFLLIGACFWFLGKTAMRALLFPLCFLIFMVPVPTAVMHASEGFMQRGSAAVAHWMFGAAGTSVFYQDLVFQLPGISLHVAPECSGMRSTIALFIVSVVTAFFFLHRPGHRVLLALFVIPLALARNGFRIFVIGELCVRFGPDMIHSFIHRRGGPLFFALSLVPFFLLLLFLQQRERRAGIRSIAASSR